MDKVMDIRNFVAAAEGDAEHVLGKFLYFSLANLLVDKEELAELCDSMCIPYTSGNRLSVSDAFRSATGDIRVRVPVTEGGETNIYLAYCRDNKRTAEILSRELVKETGAKLVIFDNDLTPSQIKALESITGASVLDRSALILDIFAQRAKTREGKLQVELAQYQYYLPRLTVWNEPMGRLGGGIGTRGPGETQLETDKRHIRSRVAKLRQELLEVRQVRGVQRRQRMKNNVPVVALVGYTNAGKSTILNALTGADIPANNRLFDTLDTTTRQLTVSDTCQVLLSDTGGFIAKLPHHPVEAFKATLEELEYADGLLHVIDASYPLRHEHMAVVERLIEQLAKPGVPVIRCYNKCDLLPDDDLPRETGSVCISAKTGAGVDELLKKIEQELGKGLHQAVFLLPYSMAGFLDTLHQNAKVLRAEYQAGGIEVEAIVDEVLLGKLSAYRKE